MHTHNAGKYSFGDDPKIYLLRVLRSVSPSFLTHFDFSLSLSALEEGGILSSTSSSLTKSTLQKAASVSHSRGVEAKQNREQARSAVEEIQRANKVGLSNYKY